MQTEHLPTTRDLVTRAKSLKGFDSSYGFAKYLGVMTNTVRNWEKGSSTLDSRGVEMIARILELDPGYVALCIAVEREKDATLAANMARLVARAAAA